MKKWILFSLLIQFIYAVEIPIGTLHGCLTLAQVESYLAQVNKEFKTLTKLSIIGMSTENRPMTMLCIGACYSKDPIPEIFLNGLHHAREPISMMALVHAIQHLLDNYEDQVSWAVSLLQTRKLYFLPVVNPDGYYFNEANYKDSQRGMHRKNRKPGCGNGEGMGVDLNRNYPVCFELQDDGASGNRCREDFRGPNPFSEVETQAIKSLIEKSNFTVALNMHAYGRMLLIPYSCKSMGYPPPVDNDYFMKLGSSLIGTFKEGTPFVMGRPYEKVIDLYSVNGDAADWMYREHGIFAMSPEVGSSGFWEPDNKVEYYAKETIPMLMRSAWASGPYLVLTNVSCRVTENFNSSVSLEIKVHITNQGIWHSMGNVKASVTMINPNGRGIVSSVKSAQSIAHKYGKEEITFELTTKAKSSLQIVIRDDNHCVMYALNTVKKIDNLVWDELDIEDQFIENRLSITSSSCEHLQQQKIDVYTDEDEKIIENLASGSTSFDTIVAHPIASSITFIVAVVVLVFFTVMRRRKQSPQRYMVRAGTVDNTEIAVEVGSPNVDLEEQAKFAQDSDSMSDSD